MPFPFTLPTTSSFSFSSSFNCNSHPSLPLSTSTYRGVVRETLKKHKRLPPTSQSAHLSSVIASINSYLPYLLAVDAGLSNKPLHGEDIDIVLKSAPLIEWRPTLSEAALPGRERSRVKTKSLEYEIFFVLSTLASSFTLVARSTLQPLYVSSAAVLDAQQRNAAVTTATKHLLDAAAICEYLYSRTESISSQPPCPDIAPSTIRALSALALAEATLLAVLKDDPYPAVFAQDRNKVDKDWMFKAPSIPKVRAHLFARLCVAASEHAAQAHSLCQTASQHSGGGSGGKIIDSLTRYLEDLRRTSRAKACRFFGIDAELGGQTGTAIAWLHAGLKELGVDAPSGKAEKSSVLGLGRLKNQWSERREDKKIAREEGWGADAGRFEESKVIEMLEVKWQKMNNTINTQAIPPIGPLLSQMPSGREIHSVKEYTPPILDREILDSSRAIPDRSDDFGNDDSSSDEVEESVPGAFPAEGSSTARAYY